MDSSLFSQANTVIDQYFSGLRTLPLFCYFSTLRIPALLFIFAYYFSPECISI